MTQSYKVFIGGSVLTFVNESKNQAVFNSKFTNPKAEEWLTIIEALESSKQHVQVSGNVVENWKNFASNYSLVEAAGGLVENEDGSWLFIHRNGMWDLPKGKLEKNESIEECAIREVAEECGIEQPTITKPMSITYHTYALHSKRILKPTYWFMMRSSDPSELIPQTEEGITEVKWISSEEARTLAESSYGSIRQVVEEGLLAN